MQSKKTSSRFFLIDSIRGFALINMLVYHLCYDIFMMNSIDRGWSSYPWIIAWERFICITFIIISGVSIHFSKSVYKRGCIVNLFGLLITATTVILLPREAVWFGILNLLGSSMLITQLLRKILDKINPIAGMIVSFLLFAVFYNVPYRYIGFFKLRLFRMPDFLYNSKISAFFGFPPSGFSSSDYFPLLPWIFMFVLGYFLWKVICNLRFDGYFKLKIPVLNTFGKYSLWIYMIHQPILIGLVWLFLD